MFARVNLGANPVVFMRILAPTTPHRLPVSLTPATTHRPPFTRHAFISLFALFFTVRITRRAGHVPRRINKLTNQARDAKEIIANGYEAVDIQPFDLFPQTRHIENIITFQDTRTQP